MKKQHKIEISCRDGAQHNIVSDFDGTYCTVCFEEFSGPSKKPCPEDMEITKTLKRLVSLIDKRAKRLGVMNGRNHTLCLEAMDTVLAAWATWRKE